MSDNSTVTKEKIAKHLQENSGLSFLICEEIVDDIFDEIINLALRDEKMMMHRFGVWKVNHKKSRPGFNIRSNSSVDIPARSVLQFSSSQLLRDKLNGK